MACSLAGGPSVWFYYLRFCLFVSFFFPSLVVWTSLFFAASSFIPFYLCIASHTSPSLTPPQK